MGHGEFTAAGCHTGPKNQVMPNRQKGCKTDHGESRLTAVRNELKWSRGTQCSAAFLVCFSTLFGGHVCKNRRTCFCE
jgi:hypothetical protein